MSAHRNDDEAGGVGRLLPGLLMLGLASAIAWASFSAGEPQAYLFPRLLSVVMLVLTLLNLAGEWRRRGGYGLSGPMLWRMLPGFAVLLGLTAWAAQTIGFYVASFAAMFLIVCFYDPRRRSPGRFARHALVSLAFMAVLYLLFQQILQVQTPRGLLF